MTNFEKDKDEILDVANKIKFECDGDIAVNKKTGKPVCCCDIYCKDCLFGTHNEHCESCVSLFIKWLYEEYKEPIILDDFTKELLVRIYKKGYRYIAMDRSKIVYMYKDKPHKKSTEWCVEGKDWCQITEFAEFDFLSWEDEEPTLIENLIGDGDE